MSDKELKPDWRTLLCKILRCFQEEEGTWYDFSWRFYDISGIETKAIEAAYQEYEKEHPRE